MSSLKERLLARLIPVTESGCWIWEGFTVPAGYGFIGGSGEILYTHRASYELFKGEIPPGMFVRHTCDVPCCCNPDHLVLGSHQDNMNDMVNRNRQAKGANAIHTPKLTEREVLEIRRKYSEGGFNQKELAECYGVNRYTISAIINRKSWKHI